MQLVGLTGVPLQVGCHLRWPESREATDGWVTSAGRAALSDEPIGLAMVRRGRERVGTEIDIFEAGKRTGRVRVVNTPFFDTAGERLNG
jgi:glycine cleavage system aminomethyltransferase T